MVQDLFFLHGKHTPDCVATVDKHFEGYYTLQYSPACDLELAYDAQEFVLAGAWFWPACPGPHIRFRNRPGVPLRWDHYYVAFNGPRVAAWQRDGLFPLTPQPAQADYTGDFAALLALSHRRDAWGARLAANALERLLLLLAEQRQTRQPPEPWLGELLQRLDRDPGENLDYAALARAFGMAPSTLRRRFREALGVSLHQYVLQCRIGRACQLLLQSRLPVKSIAAALGYREVQFFTRQFRHHTGLPPAQYRASALEASAAGGRG